MQIVYGLQAYDRADLPRIRLRNLYAEKAPTSRAQVALLARPSLVTYRNLGAGPVRGLYGVPGAVGGALYALAATTLYRDDVALGTIPGSYRTSMAASATQLLIANDVGLYITDGSSLSPVDFPDDAGVSSVAFINGYFLASRTDSQQFYWSAILDGSSWDALDYASAERAPDNIVAIWIVSDQIWIFGEITTEVWVATGDAEVPFQRVDGRLYDQGCLSKDTIAKLDNSIFWVGHDFKVYRGDAQPLRVSDHAIEQAIETSDVADLRAWAYPFRGSVFYSLTTSSGTFQLNVATGEWNDAASYGRDHWRAHLGLFYGQDVIAGDDEQGLLWRLDADALMDGTDPVERRWTAILDERGFIDNLVLDVSTGNAPQGIEPVCEVRISRDQGATFGQWNQASSGVQGQYRRLLAFRRLGMVDGDGAILDFRMTDPTTWRVSAIRMNEPLSGRSRV